MCFHFNELRNLQSPSFYVLMFLSLHSVSALPPPFHGSNFAAKYLFQSDPAPAAYVGFLQQDIHHLAIPATPQSTSSEKGDAEYSPRFSRADQLFEVEKYMKYLITKV